MFLIFVVSDIQITKSETPTAITLGPDLTDTLPLTLTRRMKIVMKRDGEERDIGIWGSSNRTDQG